MSRGRLASARPATHDLTLLEEWDAKYRRLCVAILAEQLSSASRRSSGRPFPWQRVVPELGDTHGRRRYSLHGLRISAVRQLFRFCLIGAVSTLVSLALFVAFRQAIGPQLSNLLALLLTVAANTAANRRITFEVTGPEGRLRHQAGGYVAFGIGLGLSSSCLAVLHAASVPTRWVEAAVLVAANLAASLVRFLLLRRWIAG
jgi:putative flippase GtrA